jgi:hypothetical protein
MERVFVQRMPQLRLPLALLVFVGISAAIVIPAPPVAAHERVMVGTYELMVGWRSEPAIVGVLNGLDLGIQKHLANNTTAWVVGVATNLNATLKTGPVSTLQALAPQDGRPGWYTFEVIPTVAGSYSVRIQGTLNTTHIDVTVNLDPVELASIYQFPVSEPGASDLQASINQLNAQLAVLQTLLTILIAVAVIAVAIGVASLVVAVRSTQIPRRSP